VWRKENPNYTSALNELATLHFNIGNYEKSEPFYIEENLILKKVLGAANSEYASSLRNLANLYAAMGNYAKAEPLYTECALNDLEKELARTVAGFGQASQQVKWQEVQAALKPNEAAIEFVSFRFYQKKETDSTLYAALVLLPGTDTPQFFPGVYDGLLQTLVR
jgi:tetratricopeptide (TPR) repeat protein